MSTVTAAKRLIPLLDRVLVEKIVPPSRSAGGILLPETTAKLNSGTVIEVGPGLKNKDGNVVPVDVKKGDTVLLPEYGGSHVKLEGRETPCRTSLQTEIDEEDPDDEELCAPQGLQVDRLTRDPTLKRNEYGELGGKPEHAVDDGALSNRDLLNQLQAVAVGIRDFDEPRLTQILGEVKDRRARAKKSAPDKSKVKAKEPFGEKKVSIPRKASTTSTSKAILKAASKVRKGIIVNESKAREKLAFSDTYLEKAFGLSSVTHQISEKHNASISAKKSTNSTNDSLAKKPLKAKTLTKQPGLLFTGDVIKPTKKEARPREVWWDSEEKMTTKKKAKVSVKSIVNQRICVLPPEKRVLPEAALVEVLAAKKEHEAAETEMTKLMDEIRSIKTENIKDLPSDITERWISTHAKNLRSAFNFHSTTVKHTLAAMTPKVDN